MGTEEPRTINELFSRAVIRSAARPVMRSKRDQAWRDLTGAQLGERVHHLALGLRQLGVTPGDRVALLAESSPEWSITDYAILACGAVNVPIYTTQAVDQVGFILRNSGARLLLVSTHKQLRRIQPALGSFKGKSAPPVILFESTRDASVEHLAAVEARGAEARGAEPGLFERISGQARPEDLATIIYTSGTTGEPKGVLLTHRNLTFDALRTGDAIGPRADDIALSFLPLSHVFERLVLYVYLHYGIQICFARGVETVAEDIREIRPTIVTAVPRLFEKIYAQINKTAAAAPPWQQKIFHRSLAVGRRYAMLQDRGESIPVGLRLAHRVVDRLVFRKWRAAVGGRIRFFFSGGAALSPELAYIFLGAGILILQGYGLTETSPVVAVNLPDANRVGTIGPPIPGVKVRLAGDGEILVQGENVMQGYYQMPEETASVLVQYTDGVWFHTGDIGTIDGDGYIRITDRKKDLIKTSLGKYIAPQPIENLIRAIPLVEQVIVIGNHRKFPSALIVPRFEALSAYAESLNLQAKDRRELLRHPRILEFFKKKIDEVTPDLAPHEKIKKLALLDQEFSVEGGELTPTLKVRRNFVEERHRATIDALYPKFDVEVG
ncbi:MAG TPA: long-chain fatty acid--CoA ligase [Blastocatellia bacterium]|nr:long-chain fatty acid--CoA ligase [Blastocatellia bacterium]